jgi:hypothetical protein
MSHIKFKRPTEKKKYLLHTSLQCAAHIDALLYVQSNNMEALCFCNAHVRATCAFARMSMIITAIIDSTCSCLF